MILYRLTANFFLFRYVQSLLDAKLVTTNTETLDPSSLISLNLKAFGCNGLSEDIFQFINPPGPQVQCLGGKGGGGVISSQEKN